MTLTTWVWVTVAVILLAGEILSTGLLMLPFGVGALTSALASALGYGPEIQWITFLVVSSVLMITLQRWLARRRSR